jgi:hypothetical protein
LVVCDLTEIPISCDSLSQSRFVRMALCHAVEIWRMRATMGENKG